MLIIDVQRGLFDQEPRPFEADAVVQRINALAARARFEGVPCSSSSTNALRTSWRMARKAGSSSAGSTHQTPTISCARPRPTPFQRTRLQDLLDPLGVRRVVLCGYACEFCIDTTARRAAALGYEVTLAADAHTTHDKAHASGALIRAHENATLPDITSFGPVIRATPSHELAFAG